MRRNELVHETNLKEFFINPKIHFFGKWKHYFPSLKCSSLLVPMTLVLRIRIFFPSNYGNELMVNHRF